MAAAPDPQVCNHGKGAPCPTIRDGPPDVLGVTDALPEVGPAIGAIGLLGLLLRSMLGREKQWQTERAELVAEHERRYDKAAADYERHLGILRGQIESLEVSVRKLTTENGVLRKEVRDLRGEIRGGLMEAGDDPEEK